MDLATARALTSPLGAEALSLAEAEVDPGSLAAGDRLRRRFDADLAAAALDQVDLRRRGRAKFGEPAARLFLTREGLEQATRPGVAAWRAARLVDAGAREVWDLGCGIGADALALADAGLAVTAVELDPATAHLAAANLGARARVLCADATAATVSVGAATFCDPARRDARGRVWSIDGMTPPWDFAIGTLRRGAPACVKVGPGIGHALLPDGCLAEWVSDGGDVVECGLWPGDGMAATLLPTGERLVRDAAADPAVTGPRRFLHEPDGAALRAGCLPRLAAELGLTLVASQIAYLASDEPVASPWLTTFEVLETLPYKEKALRGWARATGVGTLEIKKRGIDVDPAALRRRLKPAGPAAATLILTPTPDGVVALVVRRVRAPERT